MNTNSLAPWLLAATLVVASAAPSGALVPDDEREQPVLWEALESGRGLGVPYRDAIREALHAAAYEAGVAICSQNGFAYNDPAFRSVCSDDFSEGNEEQRLVWSADFDDAAEREIIILSLSLSVSHEKKSDRWQRNNLPQAKNLIIQANVPTPPETPEARRRELVARGLYDLIAGSPDIREWFAGLQEHPHLLRRRPRGDFGEPIASRFAQEPPPPEDEGEAGDEGETKAEAAEVEDAAPAESWEDREDAVADLLIEGSDEAAKEHAEALLAEDGLPDHVRERVDWLLATAEQRLAARRAEARPEAKPEPLDVTFDVRVPEPGAGFREGADGRLRISARGITFTPSGSAGDQWTVPWSSFEEAGRAEGLWDVSSPLVIRTRDGERHFLVERKPGGSFGDGRAILNHIEKGQRAR